MARVVDIIVSSAADGGTIVNPRNACGSRVAKSQLPGCGDFSVVGVPVTVKMPVDIVRSILRGRGATFATSK